MREMELMLSGRGLQAGTESVSGDFLKLPTHKSLLAVDFSDSQY
jgi:hypothetical protein